MDFIPRPETKRSARASSRIYLHASFAARNFTLHRARFPFKRCLKCCIACNLSSAHVFPPHYCNKGIARRISSSLEESFHGYFVSLSYDALVPGRENIHLRNYWKANKKSTINFAEFNEIDNAWKSGNFFLIYPSVFTIGKIDVKFFRGVEIS